MKLTLVHPCIGRIPGKEYIRSWQMEPLAPAYLAALVGDDVEVAVDAQCYGKHGRIYQKVCQYPPESPMLNPPRLIHLHRPPLLCHFDPSPMPHSMLNTLNLKPDPVP